MLRSLLLLLMGTVVAFGQDQSKLDSYWSMELFGGSIIKHNKDVTQLVRAHPWGLMASYNFRTHGQNYWQQVYGYPDWGFTLMYQDFDNTTLGQSIAVYGHYSFKFFKRHLEFKVGQGISFNTNPFDLVDNFKNTAFGSHLMSSTFFILNYQQPITAALGIHAGVGLLHQSNGNSRAPNNGNNMVLFNFGASYDFDTETVYEYQRQDWQDFSEPVHFNGMFRIGWNESDYLSLGQHPFIAIGAYVDKRLGYTSSVLLGAEYFYSESLATEIEYVAAAFPNRLDGNENGSRIGLFAGHELHLGAISLPAHLGYYVYWPYQYQSRIYVRIGVKYAFYKNLFATISLKAHGAKAEGIEWGIGYRI